MFSATEPNKSELAPKDREAIVRNLDACVAALDEYAGRRTLPEIKIRSMLAVLRDEMAVVEKDGVSSSPFAFGGEQPQRARA
ncbi:MAG TPA: hypothetical protein VG734_09105 [Lacunisphaera sp.]|nr:hypothetical protein [Lacunisphaera sp.]